MNFRSIFTLVTTLIIGTAALAHDYQAGEILLDHPYARATMPMQPAAGAYLTIENKGKTADRLIALASPAARNVELHTMSMEGNIMKMRAVPELELKPADKVVMKPGSGYHIMLLGLVQPLKAGDKFPLTLTFEKAGKVEVSVWVEEGMMKNSAAMVHNHPQP